VGDAAKNQFAANPHRTIFDIVSTVICRAADAMLTSVQKRLIGRKFNEKEVQNDIKHFPFKVVNKNGQPHVKVEVHNEETTFTPEEISAMVLGKVSIPEKFAKEHN